MEIAAPLAIAIQQARLREELGRQTGELERRVAERGAALRAATAELETMLYAVSHDLRDPLRHICGFSQLLLDDAGASLDPAVQHYARRIRDGASRMSALVDDLVHLARVARQDLMRRPVDLTTLVEDVVSQLQSQAEGREVEWRVAAAAGTVDATRRWCGRALQSLLSQRAQVHPARASTPSSRIRPIEHEGQAGLAVQDNGVGFKMAYAGKLFGVFQRLHRPDEFEGNGAGLALVQRVAQKHGGRVWADSGADGGATFYLTLGRAGRLMLPDELDLLLVEARPARRRSCCSARSASWRRPTRIGVARDGEEALDYLLGRGAYRHRLGGAAAAAGAARAQAAPARRPRGAPHPPRQPAHRDRARGGAHLVGRGARGGPVLPGRGQQLRPEADRASREFADSSGRSAGTGSGSTGRRRAGRRGATVAATLPRRAALHGHGLEHEASLTEVARASCLDLVR